jgi:hypothetical protein
VVLAPATMPGSTGGPGLGRYVPGEFGVDYWEEIPPAKRSAPKIGNLFGGRGAKCTVQPRKPPRGTPACAQRWDPMFNGEKL